MDEQSMRRGVQRAETVSAEARWRPVSDVRNDSDGVRALLARWVPRADGGARWKVSAIGQGEDTCRGVDESEMALVAADESAVRGDVAAAIAESWAFGRTCLQLDEGGERVEARHRWCAGRWPAEVPGRYREQLALLRGRVVSLVESVEAPDGDERIARLRASIERIVAEIYGLQVDELVSLETLRHDD